MITLDENRLFSNKQTRIYIYRLTNDTGFAPCVDNGVFTLSCCKGGQIRKGKEINTGVRYWIGTGRDGVDVDNENVFLIGLFNGKMLFTARIDSVMEMIDYYSRHR